MRLVGYLKFNKKGFYYFVILLILKNRQNINIYKWKCVEKDYAGRARPDDHSNIIIIV